MISGIFDFIIYRFLMFSYFTLNNKINGLKKELSSLYLRKFAITEACSRQSQALIALAKMQNQGLQLNLD